jgi:hypothetical protein
VLVITVAMVMLLRSFEPCGIIVMTLFAASDFPVIPDRQFTSMKRNCDIRPDFVTSLKPLLNITVSRSVINVQNVILFSKQMTCTV